MFKQKKQSETPCIKVISDWLRLVQEILCFYRISLNIFAKDILLLMYF